MTKMLNFASNFCLLLILSVYFYTIFCNGQSTHLHSGHCHHRTMSPEVKMNALQRMRIITQCLNQSNITFEVIKNAHLTPKDLKIANSFLGFFRCLTESCGLLQDGVVHPENLISFALIPHNLAQKDFQATYQCLESIKNKVKVTCNAEMEQIMNCLKIIFKDVIAEADKKFEFMKPHNLTKIEPPNT